MYFRGGSKMFVGLSVSVHVNYVMPNRHTMTHWVNSSYTETLDSNIRAEGLNWITKSSLKSLRLDFWQKAVISMQELQQSQHGCLQAVAHQPVNSVCSDLQTPRKQY